MKSRTKLLERMEQRVPQVYIVEEAIMIVMCLDSRVILASIQIPYSLLVNCTTLLQLYCPSSFLFCKMSIMTPRVVVRINIIICKMPSI